MVLLVLPPAEHGLDREKSRVISAMPLDGQRPREILASGPELRIANAAAQTRMVSAGEFCPSRRELSRHLKYIALARIPEFESYHPSQTVRSLPIAKMIATLDEHSQKDLNRSGESSVYRTVC
jgi:hypothetical protein